MEEEDIRPEHLMIGNRNKVIAVEPSHDLAKTCRSKGIETLEETIGEVDK